MQSCISGSFSVFCSGRFDIFHLFASRSWAMTNTVTSICSSTNLCVIEISHNPFEDSEILHNLFVHPLVRLGFESMPEPFLLVKTSKRRWLPFGSGVVIVVLVVVAGPSVCCGCTHKQQW